MSIKVYTRMSGKFASWEVGTRHHAVAIVTVAREFKGNKLAALGRWAGGPLLAVIPGGKARRSEVAA